MRQLTLGVVICAMALGTAVRAQAPEPQMMAPIQKFIDSFNKGDIAGAASTHAADVAIIDEVPPFLWQGPKAAGAWIADLMKSDEKRGVSDQKVTIGTATRVEADGNTAYVIVPATYTFKEKGTAMKAMAQITFALRKGAGGWLIHAWTWTGGRAQAATSAGGK